VEVWKSDIFARPKRSYRRRALSRAESSSPPGEHFEMPTHLIEGSGNEMARPSEERGDGAVAAAAAGRREEGRRGFEGNFQFNLPWG
jgi:hypothetical protein